MSTADILRAAGVTREQLGRAVRDAWIIWASRQPAPEPSWLVPFDDLGPADREADMLIGVELFRLGWDHRAQAGP